MIEIKNLYFKYDEIFVLKNISMRIKDGDFIAIIGANGSGKTTLAKHLNALLLPEKGDVIVDGFNTKKHESDVRKLVGFVFQNFEDQLIHSVVNEDIAFGLENLEIDSRDIIKTVDDVLDRLKIRQIAKSNVNMISIGQKQLAALAGVLAMKPKHIVFDEPTTMLDERNKNNIIGIMRDLNKKEGITIVMVTNILEDIKCANSVLLLKNGSVVFKGKKSGLSKVMLKRAGLYD